MDTPYNNSISNNERTVKMLNLPTNLNSVSYMEIDP